MVDLLFPHFEVEFSHLFLEVARETCSLLMVPDLSIYTQFFQPDPPPLPPCKFFWGHPENFSEKEDGR